ncbi:MAG: hypothetical protein ACK5JT_08595 [Hyphomicrobiaceae bacterium]
MAATIYWVDDGGPGKVAVVQRPRSAAIYGELKRGGIDVLVSMLKPDEEVEVGLGNAAAYCEACGIEFVSVPVVDHGLPQSVEDTYAIVDHLCGCRRLGLGVGAHCFAGLGRSPLMISAMLIHGGLSARRAVELVSDARGAAVPEMPCQQEWLRSYEAFLVDIRKSGGMIH